MLCPDPDHSVEEARELTVEWSVGRRLLVVAHQRGSNVVVLAPDVAEDFPDSESVNEALRESETVT